jgi:hypothetical protein
MSTGKKLSISRVSGARFNVRRLRDPQRSMPKAQTGPPSPPFSYLPVASVTSHCPTKTGGLPAESGRFRPDAGASPARLFSDADHSPISQWTKRRGTIVR